MIDLATGIELYANYDWARDQLLGRAAALDDSGLDRKFEMGEGSLRATLRHIWAAEHVWLCRWKGVDFLPRMAELRDPAVSISKLAQDWAATGEERNAYIRSMGEKFADRVTYQNFKGETYTYPVGEMLLHVANHGTHHRAQAINMLRHLGAPPFKPGLDYIFWRLENASRPAPKCSLAALRTYFTYNDWGNHRLLAIAKNLPDTQLDRRFEMGIGTLRATLLHIRFAEQWWLENWTLGPDRGFPELPEGTGIADAARLVEETITGRQRYMSSLKDEDLQRIVEARPRPGVVRQFPLAVTMLQLCHHGTHHRAQALNMLRHVGAEVPGMDYLVSLG